MAQVEARHPEFHLGLMYWRPGPKHGLFSAVFAKPLAGVLDAKRSRYDTNWCPYVMQVLPVVALPTTPQWRFPGYGAQGLSVTEVGAKDTSKAEASSDSASNEQNWEDTEGLRLELKQPCFTCGNRACICLSTLEKPQLLVPSHKTDSLKKERESPASTLECLD